MDISRRRLILTGQLPSFYLKQVLQTALRDLPDIDQIENRIDVVNNRGLSSEGGSPKPALARTRQAERLEPKRQAMKTSPHFRLAKGARR